MTGAPVKIKVGRLLIQTPRVVVEAYPSAKAYREVYLPPGFYPVFAFLLVGATGLLDLDGLTATGEGRVTDASFPMVPDAAVMERGCLRPVNLRLPTFGRIRGSAGEPGLALDASKQPEGCLRLVVGDVWWRYEWRPECFVRVHPAPEYATVLQGDVL